MKHTIDVELQRIEKAFAKSNAGLALPVKLKMAKLILNLRRREMRLRKKFGLLVILGWKKQWQKYADTPDASQDLFARRKINIMKIGERNNAEQNSKQANLRRAPAQRDNIIRTINFDGAILVDPRGNIIHSGTMLEGLRPRATAHRISPRRAPDLSTRFGFKRKVHMRHITAITSSYTFKGTTVFTISEETNDMHIFENGKIVYSTVRGEGK